MSKVLVSRVMRSPRSASNAPSHHDLPAMPRVTTICQQCPESPQLPTNNQLCEELLSWMHLVCDWEIRKLFLMQLRLTYWTTIANQFLTYISTFFCWTNNLKMVWTVNFICQYNLVCFYYNGPRLFPEKGCLPNKEWQTADKGWLPNKEWQTALCLPNKEWQTALFWSEKGCEWKRFMIFGHSLAGRRSLTFGLRSLT